MASLLDIICYNNKWYTELTSKEHREQIENLVQKLDPLKEEICRYPNARINITKDKTITTNHLPDDIASKIEQIVAV
jgi:hypothetical protein